MDREAIAYMLFISSALYLKGRNIKPFCQEALYTIAKDGIFYIERWHLMIQKMASFTAKDATFCKRDSKDTESIFK